MTRQPWARETAKEGGRGVLLVIGLLIIIAVIGGVTWAFKVATSDVKGRGDVTRKTNSGDNQIFAQQQFQDMFNDIKATDRKLAAAAADAKGQLADSPAAVRYAGLRNYCADVVGQYNAAARKVTQERFRDADLPAQIDDSDPATDCEANR